MDFNDSPDESQFRAEARAWIVDNAPVHLRRDLENTSHSGLNLGSRDVVAESKLWQQKKFDNGWACPTWPAEYGGRNASPMERLIWNQEEGVYSLLSYIFLIGHGMCGPTLMAYAGSEHKSALLPPLARGDRIWCQLFSEPAAGSDLAGLRTRAVRDGDDWLVTGQKIWTSWAQYADYGLLLARTDPSVTKHAGLTMFFLDMRTQGVEVRPIQQANGQSEFNEVFLTDVRISDSQRLGEVGGGWGVSLNTLMNERLAIGGNMSTGFEEVLQFVRSSKIDNNPAIENDSVRAQIADWFCRANGLKFTSARLATALSQGVQPGPEASICKLVAGNLMQEIALSALDMQGLAGLATDQREFGCPPMFTDMALRAPATRIEGGTDEILRNIIGERVLGLPADVRVDKNRPFSELLGGTAA